MRGVLSGEFWTRRKALVLALVLVIISGSIIVATWPAGRSAALPDGTAVAPGVVVVLPHGTAHLKMWTTPATSASLAALGATRLEELSAPLDYQASARLPRGTEMAFQTRTGLSSPVVEGFFDQQTGRWTAEPTTYNPITGVAVATVAHFSVHGLFTWPVDALKAVLAGLFDNVFGGWSVSQAPPACGAAHGVMMYYTGGQGSVASCHDAAVVRSPAAGDPGAATINLRLEDRRNYPVSVAFPWSGTANVSDPGSVGAQIGAAITRFVSMPQGENRVLVPAAATGTVSLPGSVPPFRGLRITASLDGEAFLVSILTTALDEIAAMDNVHLEAVTKDFLDGWSGESTLYRIQSELTVTDLSPGQIRTIADVGLDAVLTAFQDNKDALRVSAAKVVVSLAQELIGSIEGLYDTATGQAFHTYTFASSGSTWTRHTDLRSVDWGSVQVPGNWFKGPAEVTLSGGEATGVPTGIRYLGQPETETVYASVSQVQYGTISGLPVAALPVGVQAGVTADSVRAEGWVIYTATTSGLRVVGVLTPQYGQVNSWTYCTAPTPSSAISCQPEQLYNVSYITQLVFGGNQITAYQAVYLQGDSTAQPSGGAISTWSYNGSALAPTQTIPHTP